MITRIIKYTFTGENEYRVYYSNGKITSVPEDNDNTDYQEVLEWINTEGNTLEENVDINEGGE